jgi:hypothetical protein
MIHPRPTRSLCRNLLALTLMGACLPLMPGCDSIAYVSNAFEDDRIPARYRLPEGTVAVLVDDPDYRLGDPSLANVAAAWAIDGIRKNVSKVKVIPVTSVVQLSRKIGQDFSSMPVDQIGSELGATHVVYVFVESAGVTGDPGLYRPRAQVRVNVIEVATGKRVFPSGQFSPDASSQGTATQGEPVTVNMHYTTSEQNQVAEATIFMRQLAQEIGSSVAKVFYKHHPPQVPKYTD